MVARLVISSRRAAPGIERALQTLVDAGFVALDVETTGLDPRRDALVSAAAVPFADGAPRAGFVSLVAPGRPIPPAASAVHGLTDRDVAGAPPPHTVVAQIDALCAEEIVVGHDIGFDLAVLAAVRAAHRLSAPVTVALDTRRLYRALHRHARDTRLEAVAPRLGVSTEGRHTAHGDARMAGHVLLALMPDLQDRGARTVGDLLRLQRSAAPYD